MVQSGVIPPGGAGTPVGSAPVTHPRSNKDSGTTALAIHIFDCRQPIPLMNILVKTLVIFPRATIATFTIIEL